VSLALLGAQGLPGDEANVITMLLRTAGGKQMPTSPIALIKRVTLNVRIKSEDRDLIDRAARARGKNRTDFILDATRAAAEETLLDQVLVAASPVMTRRTGPGKATDAAGACLIDAMLLMVNLTDLEVRL
jgi:uncharacterized protein (DUF1778 family)